MSDAACVRSRAAVEASAAFRLGVRDSKHRGLAGERLGNGIGASLEFQDRRNYVPGDDVRHLDWGAYARSDQLMVRLYREEILPQVDLLLDTSRSIGCAADKRQRVVDLAWLLAMAGRAGGYHVRIICCGDRPERIPLEQLEHGGVEFDGRLSLLHCLGQTGSLLRPGSIRLLVSDFLAPASAADVLRPLTVRGSGVELVQVLGEQDVQPQAGAALRLQDAETSETIDVVLDRATIASYKQRLDRLRAELESEARRRGGRFHAVTTQSGIAAVCRDTLLPSGLLTPV